MSDRKLTATERRMEILLSLIATNPDSDPVALADIAVQADRKLCGARVRKNNVVPFASKVSQQAARDEARHVAQGPLSTFDSENGWSP